MNLQKIYNKTNDFITKHIQIKNICFSVTIDCSEGKDSFPPILFLGESSCVWRAKSSKKIN